MVLKIVLKQHLLESVLVIASSTRMLHLRSQIGHGGRVKSREIHYCCDAFAQCLAARGLRAWVSTALLASPCRYVQKADLIVVAPSIVALVSEPLLRPSMLGCTLCAFRASHPPDSSGPDHSIFQQLRSVQLLVRLSLSSSTSSAFDWGNRPAETLRLASRSTALKCSVVLRGALHTYYRMDFRRANILPARRILSMSSQW